MKQLGRRCLRGIIPYVPGKPIEEVKRELGLASVAKLASNENALGPSPRALAAAKNAMEGVNRYPDGASFYLKRALAKKFELQPRNFIIGNGSDELIVLAARAFLEKGDEVIIAKPTFLIYDIVAKISGARIRHVPLKSFRYDLKAMKSAVSARTKLVFIANPDNPTGTYVTGKEMRGFLRRLPNDVIVFIDEAYYEFARSNKDYPNGIDFISRNNVIVARTFSKAYGLSGLRVGYAIAGPALIDVMNRVREPFNVNSVAQTAALAALTDSEFLKKTLLFTDREKRKLCGAFESMRLSYIPSATNFVLVDLKRSSKKVFKALLKRGFIVRDMNAWGMTTFIRVTVGTAKENDSFIKTLRDILD